MTNEATARRRRIEVAMLRHEICARNAAHERSFGIYRTGVEARAKAEAEAATWERKAHRYGRWLDRADPA